MNTKYSANKNGSIEPPRLTPIGHPIDLLGRIKDLPLGHCSVLNLGAGICGNPLSAQVMFMPCRHLINVEKFSPYMAELKTLGFAATQTTFIEMDILEYLRSPAVKRTDIALMLDVLEHLEPEPAREVLDRLKRLVKRRLLIWLPLGECPIEPIHENPYQVHLSTWHGDEPEFQGARVERFEKYHTHLSPPADAGWVIWDK